MANFLNYIIESTIQPVKTNVLWIKNGVPYYYNKRWKPLLGGGSSGGYSTLVNLQDVLIKNPEGGDVLSFDVGTELWINKKTMYHHVQMTPSTIWTIPHGLSKYPNVKILDSSKQLCMADVYYVDENTVRIEFGAQQSGSAFLD